MAEGREPTDLPEGPQSWPPQHDEPLRSGRYATWALLFVAFGLRLYRLAFQSIWWDEGHILFVAGHDLSIIPIIPAMDVHPPLYFWVLHTWMGLVGTSEFGLRYLSVLFGVLTVALMYRVGREQFGTVGGWIAALLAAFSPLYLAYSQEVRMYALVAVLSLSSIYLFCRYLRASAGTSSFSVRVYHLLPYAVVTAMGLYTHYFVGFLLILENMYWLGALVLTGRWRKLSEWTTWAAGQVVIVLLLAPQIYTAARQVTSYRNTNLIPPEFAEYWVESWRAFTLGVDRGSVVDRSLMLLVAVVLLAGIAARFLPRPDRRGKPGVISLLALCFVIPLLLYYLVLQDRASFSPRYMIVVTPALYLLLAYAVWQLGRRWVSLGAIALLALLAVFVISDYRYYFDPAYHKDDTRGLARFLEGEATADDVVFVDVPHPLDYYYRGQAPQRYLFVDIHTIDDVLTDAAQGRDRLFFIRWRQSDTDPRGAVDFLLDKYGAYQGGKQFRGYDVVWYTLPKPAHFSVYDELEPARVNFGGQVLLVGKVYGGRGQGETATEVEVNGDTVPAGRSAWVTLVWQATEDACPGEPCLLDDFRAAISLHDSRGHRVGQVDKDLLSDRHLRTTGWQAGEIAINVYTLPVAPGTPPGEYTIEVIVYRAQDSEPLPIMDDSGAPRGIAAPIGKLEVVRPTVPPMPSSLSIGTASEQPLGEELLLLGYDLPGRSVEDGAKLPLSLFWQARQDVQQDYLVRTGLFDDEGTLRAEVTQAPAGGTYRTTSWIEGEIVRDWVDLLVPGATPAGDYDLRVAFLPAGESTTVAEASLGTVSVRGRTHLFDAPEIPQPQEANFSDKIELLGYDLDQSDSSRLKLTLYWQALEEMSTSFKVFTHLLGPDDKLWGQKDDYPGGGTSPTTGWLPGEFIVDSYEIPIDPGAPPGRYSLEVGFYEPDSGARLPVADAGGQIAGDHVVLAEIDIGSQ